MRPWLEVQDVKPGDTLVIRLQSFEVTQVAHDGNRVTLTGTTEDGRTVIYIGAKGELVQRGIE